MTELREHIKNASLLLAAFALVGTGLVAITDALTKERIAENQRHALLSSLNRLIAAERIDNDLYTDKKTIQDERLGTSEAINVYLARKDAQPVAAVFSAIAPNGYNGKIDLLIGINMDGTIAGVRVTNHKETPGLGDKIEVEKSDWIRSFDGKSLSNTANTDWGVKKDGGQFDQFTGATITPRAIVQAVHNALIYFDEHRFELFEEEKPAQPIS